MQDKKSLQLGPDDYLHVEGFALNVFSKADKQDRAGRADMYANFLTLFSWSDVNFVGYLIYSCGICTCVYINNLIHICMYICISFMPSLHELLNPFYHMDWNQCDAFKVLYAWILFHLSSN